MGAIEDIILANDNRGISALRPLLPGNYCTEAARYVLDHLDTVLIATGFYILSGNAVETDGPPGAAAIGRAIETLGGCVVYVTDEHGEAVVRAAVGDGEVVTYASPEALIAEYAPSLLIAIERCAPSADGVYRNMRGVDISEHSAKIDALFGQGVPSVGIGDGGNEIGMGLFANEVAAAPDLPDNPAVTRTEKLVIASVSNWGGYGLVAAMSQLTDRDLLPTVEGEERIVQACVAAGAVDGFSGERVAKVDGFELAQYGQALAALRMLLP